MNMKKNNIFECPVCHKSVTGISGFMACLNYHETTEKQKEVENLYKEYQSLQTKTKEILEKINEMGYFISSKGLQRIAEVDYFINSKGLQRSAEFDGVEKNNTTSSIKKEKVESKTTEEFEDEILKKITNSENFTDLIRTLLF